MYNKIKYINYNKLNDDDYENDLDLDLIEQNKIKAERYYDKLNEILDDKIQNNIKYDYHQYIIQKNNLKKEIYDNDDISI
jgi:hypothetical protein